MIYTRNNLFALFTYKVALERLLKTAVKKYDLSSFITEVVEQSKQEKSYFQYFYSKPSNAITPQSKPGNFYFPHHHAGLILCDLKVDTPEHLVQLYVCVFPLFRVNKKI